MKKHVLLCATLIGLGVGSQSLFAQTDMTEKIINPSFEGEFSSFTKPNDDRDIFAVEGWTTVYSGGDKNDMTIVGSSFTQDGTTWNSYDGNSYFIRQRWSNNCNVGQNQTIKDLPRGAYVLKASATLYTDNSSNIAKIFAIVNDIETSTVISNSSETAVWADYELKFNIAEGDSVVIGFNSYKNADKFKSAYDNFRLYYYGNVTSELISLQALLEEVEAMIKLKPMTDDFMHAIQDAQCVADNTSSTVDEINIAIDNLKIAIAKFEISGATVENPVNLTSKILNSAATDGSNYWTVNGTPLGTPNDESWTVPAINYFDACVWGASWSTEAYQNLGYLPTGEYELSLISRAREEVNFSAYVKVEGESDKVIALEAIGAKGGNIWENAPDDSVEKNINGGQGFGWSKSVLKFTVVEGAPVTIGYIMNAYRSERWAGISNFELYCTSDYVSFLDLVAEALEAVPTAEIPVYAQSELDNAVLEAEKLTATSSKSEVMAAIEVLNAAIAKANELITPYAGLKSTILDIKEFKMAESLVTSAEDFYFTTDDVTAQDLISAEDALFKSFVEFMTENYLSEDESFLVNPNISETNDPSISNQSIPDGWDIIMSGSGNNNFINRGEHYDGNTANIYLDAWHGTAGNLSYDASQTVNELPTALYILTAAARTNGEGVEIYANNRASDVINNGGSDGELGNGWNTITVPVIVKDGTLKVGVRTNKAKNWNGTWLGADDFAAKSIKTDATPTSISEAVSESSVLVYVVNNKVVVSGADKYSVITVDGKVIAPKAELSKGIYYVIVEGKAYPVAVK